MKKNYIDEIFWIRALSCLAVVMIHSITANRLHHPNSESLASLELFQITLMFATPAFVFISEFLISRSYRNGLPKDFFRKRIKILFLPYLAMGIIFAVVFNNNLTLKTFLFDAFTNIFMGMFIGYFILIIFQFYILHYLLHKKLNKWNPWIVLITTFIINVFYIGFFNFTSIPDSLIGEYIWKRGHWLLAIAWLFYFSLGYYCGKYYDDIKVFIQNHVIFITGSFLSTLTLLLVMHSTGILVYTGSKRVDMLLYTAATIFLIMLISTKVSKTPKIVLLISNYSFSIFLLHRFTVSTLGPFTNNDFINIILLFIIGVSSSIVLSYLINKIPFGKYIVGQPYKLKK